MLQLYNDSKKRIGTLKGFKGLCIEKVLDSGDKILTFKYPTTGRLIEELKTECYIRTKTDEYVLKAIEIGETYNSYTAQMNVEELEGTGFPFGFMSEEQTIKACLEFAFEGTGWTIGKCYVTKKRTIDEDSNVSAWDILQKAISTYRCEVKIDSLNKVIDIYDTIGEDKGCYFMEDLNLRKMQLKTDTYDFYTRIIPIGKDGIGLWIDGKNYVENYQYSTKVKTYIWKDERYTNTTSLQEDAEAKLDEMSKPYKSYTVDVLDLAKINPVYKDILDYGIGDTIHIISKRNKIKEKQRIVKIKEYPLSPQSNTVELSNTTKTFAQIQQEETKSAKTEAISASNSATKKILSDYSTTDEIESRITASAEKVTLGVKETLKDYYTKTESESAINVTKDSIELTASKIYQTKDAMGNYSTTEQVNAALKILSDAISLKVEQGDVISAINIALSGIKLVASQISLEGYTTINGGFTVDEYGNVFINSGKIKMTSSGSHDALIAFYDDTMGNVEISPGLFEVSEGDVKSTVSAGQISSPTVTATNDVLIGTGDSPMSVKDHRHQYLYDEKNWWSVYMSTANRFYPTCNNYILLGSPSWKWAAIYATDGAINTSDRNYKKDFSEIPESFERVFNELKPQLFKFKDGKRQHCGFISQDVFESMKNNGLNEMDFAAFCRDDIFPMGENGEEDFAKEPIAEIYGLRYDEFIALTVHMVQKQTEEIELLKKRVEAMEMKLA